MAHNKDKARDLKIVQSSTTQELEELVKLTVEQDLKWYKRHAFGQMLAHRISGILVITLGISLPIAINFDIENKDIIVSSLGIVIAIAASLNSFFRWGEIWKSYTAAFVSIKNHLAVWKVKMISLKQRKSVKKSMNLSIIATIELFESLETIDTKNTNEYFSTVQFPQK